MSDDFEEQLRRSLRPVEPPEGFAERVLARVEAAQSPRIRTRWPVPAGLAAALFLGLGLYIHTDQQRQELAGLEARRQVIEALRLTDQKLDIVYETVKDESGT